MTMRLQLGRHSTRNVAVCEIWDGDELVGVIYPASEDRAVHIVSKHAMQVDGDASNPAAMLTVVTFEERPQ